MSAPDGSAVRYRTGMGPGGGGAGNGAVEPPDPPGTTPPGTDNVPEKPGKLVPVPTMGLPAVRYRISRKLGQPPKTEYTFSGKEQAAIAAKQAALDAIWHQNVLDYRRMVAARTVIAMSDLVPQQTVCFINSKGYGATTASQVHISSSRGEVTNAVVTDADFNLAAGGEAGDMAQRLGKGDGGQTMTYRGLLEMLTTGGELEFGEFISHLRPTEYRVRVLAAEPIIRKNQELTAEETDRLLKALKAKCEYLCIDTLNKVSDPVTIIVVENSDVIVFTVNAGNPTSLRHLWSSMETLRSQGFEHKVNHSVVLVSNLPPDKDANDYRKFLNRLGGDDHTVRQWFEEKFVGQFVGIPHDELITLDGVVNLGALAWETRQAYIEADRAIFEQDPRFWDNAEAATVYLDLGDEPKREIFTGFEHVEVPSH